MLRRAHARPPVVRFDKVGKVFPGRCGSPEVTALAGIDLDVPEGAIVPLTIAAIPSSHA